MKKFLKLMVFALCVFLSSCDFVSYTEPSRCVYTAYWSDGGVEKVFLITLATGRYNSVHLTLADGSHVIILSGSLTYDETCLVSSSEFGSIL